ncbi:Putative inner membrane protein [Salmonella enterica subsp. enterica serovar Gallinarum]|nr:Putative inner membrane protein [Salmonella enterica subsp. enterica serovar Gallinarum]
MDWLAKYWWILVLVFLVGVLLNVIKDLKRIDHKKFLANKPELPRIAILTISGTMKKTGRRKISRKSNRI